MTEIKDILLKIQDSIIDLTKGQVQMQEDIHVLKNDVKNLQEGQAQMQEDIHVLKNDVKNLQEGQAQLQQGQRELLQKQDRIAVEVHNIAERQTKSEQITSNHDKLISKLHSKLFRKMA